MAKVYNWQIGREMEFPYEPVSPDRQIAFVFDTNKCIGCQTCSVACKTQWTTGKGQEYMWWNNVESRPYGSYPLAWDIRLLNKLGGQKWENGVYKGKTIFEAAPQGEKAAGWKPVRDDWSNPNIGEDECSEAVQENDFITVPHMPWMFYLARICNHCTLPSCLAVCPRMSIYKRKEDGIVLIDQNRCHGYQECVKYCPYKKSMFRPTTGVSEKCIACFPRVEKGLVTRCVENCIGKIRLQGWLSPHDNPREDNPIDYLVHIAKIALPLYPQLGLMPNVYYIPPINVPVPFITQMFGPGAGAAVQKYKNPAKDPKVVALLMLFGSTDQIIEKFRVTDKYCIGFNGKGDEIARVPIEEPTAIRPSYDEKRKVFRMSIT